RKRVGSPAANGANGDAAPADGAPATPRSQRVVLVIRIPQIAWPRPNLLDIYVAKRYVSVFLLAFVSLIGIFYIATFIDLADKLFRGSTTGVMLVRYFYFQTPQYVYYIIPLAALLSTLVTVGVLTKNSELIVMRACGVSLYRSAMPLLMFGILLSATLFELQEQVLAASNREAKRLEAVIRGWPTQTFAQTLSRRWIVGQNGDLYYYEYFDPAANTFTRFSRFQPDLATWRLSGLTYASDVKYTKDGGTFVWQAHQGWEREFTVTKKHNVSTPAVTYRTFAEQR